MMTGPSYELIAAAVGGDKEALEKIIQHYEPMIDAQCGGNEEIRQQIILALIDGIRHYDLNHPEKNAEYLNQKYPDAE